MSDPKPKSEVWQIIFVVAMIVILSTLMVVGLMKMTDVLTLPTVDPQGP